MGDCLSFSLSPIIVFLRVADWCVRVAYQLRVAYKLRHLFFGHTGSSSQPSAPSTLSSIAARHGAARRGIGIALLLHESDLYGKPLVCGVTWILRAGAGACLTDSFIHSLMYI